MQTSKPNAVASPNLVPAPRSPFRGTAGLGNQLSTLSLKSPSKLVSQPGGLHKKSKSSITSVSSVNIPQASSVTAAGSTRGWSESPLKLGKNRKHGSSISVIKSAKSSPVKSVKNVNAKTPSKGNANLGRSLGMAGASKDSTVLAAGGVGRMDIVTKDWEGIASSSTNNSPQKKKPACTKVSKILYPC